MFGKYNRGIMVVKYLLVCFVYYVARFDFVLV